MLSIFLINKIVKWLVKSCIYEYNKFKQIHNTIASFMTLTHIKIEIWEVKNNSELF